LIFNKKTFFNLALFQLAREHGTCTESRIDYILQLILSVTQA